MGVGGAREGVSKGGKYCTWAEGSSIHKASKAGVVSQMYSVSKREPYENRL